MIERRIDKHETWALVETIRGYLRQNTVANLKHLYLDVAPTTTQQLKLRLKACGVSNEDIDQLQDEIDDAEHDIDSMKEDCNDDAMSLLIDFFCVELDHGLFG